MNRWGVRW